MYMAVASLNTRAPVRIGELSRRVGVSPGTLRAWERRYGVLSPIRTESGYRLYSDETLRRLGFIKHAQRCGFSLADVRELLGAHDGTAREALHRKAVEKREEVEETIVALRAMSDALSCLIDDAEPVVDPLDSQESPLLSALQATTWLAAQRSMQEAKG